MDIRCGDKQDDGTEEELEEEEEAKQPKEKEINLASFEMVLCF